MTSARNATVPSVVSVSTDRKKNATAIRMAASPALKRKNFTPASRETNTSVKMMPSPRWVRNRKRINTCLTEPLVDFRPVHDVPPRRDVIGPTVLVLQVVGVFPDIDAEHDLLPFHQRAVLIRRAFDRELVAARDHPGPAASEAADSRLRELLLECVEAAERAVEGVRDRAARRTARLR